jgi:hypothetical protein
MYVELPGCEGRPVRGLPDSSGGNSTPRGDFDRFFDDSQHGHAAGVAMRDLSQVDPYVDKTIGAVRIAGLPDDLADVLPIAKPRPELRGSCAPRRWHRSARGSQTRCWSG